MEEWRGIPGFEGRYQVSDQGRVRNRHTMHVLKPFAHRDGYLQVKLCGCGVQKTRFVHRLVALAFIINPLDLPEVDHSDTIKTNNAKGNLVWVTRLENMQRASAAGLMGGKPVNVGESNGQARLNAATVVVIRQRAATGERHTAIAEAFGISRRAVSMIVSRDRWAHV